MIIFRSITLLLLFLGFFGFSQKKTTYDLSAKYKLAHKTAVPANGNAAIKTEEYLLFANKDEALFLSAKTFLRDSLSANGNATDLQLKNKLNAEAGYTIFSKSSGAEISHLENIAGQNLQYKENLLIQWNMEPQTKTIDGMQCSMATTELFGRKWIAWYAPEYKYAFGPYKFQGLPGLIVEISDASGSWMFSLSSLKMNKRELTMNEPAGLRTVSRAEFLKEVIKTSKKKDDLSDLLF